MKEKYPELVIPFDKVLAVGKAYREIEEFERAMLVFKATAAASFVKDAKVAGILEAQGQVLGSVDFMTGLWRSYPEIPSVTNAYMTLAETLYTKAPEAHRIEEIKQQKLTREDMMLGAIRILVHYLTL